MQKSISLLPTSFIFALQDGQSRATFFFIGLSIWVLHFMSGQAYFQNFFFIVGALHFGQVCSETSSPCSLNFSLFDNFKISLFIGVLIFLKRYSAIARGYSGKQSFVWSPFRVFGKALKGTIMWKPLLPENLMPMLWIPWDSSSSIKSFAAILP